MRFPRLVRHADGGVRVTLPTAERALLEDMVRTIRAAIAGGDADTPHDEAATPPFVFHPDVDVGDL
ncbi:MAG: hypothetical protein ABGZ36_00540, partial [Actinomycetota bacterium]